MTYSEARRTATRRARIRLTRIAGPLLIIAATAVALGTQLAASSSPSAAQHTAVPRHEHRGTRGVTDEPPSAIARSEHGGPIGEADGAIPAGTTVLDDAVPGVTKLDPALLKAVRRAATDAQVDGVEFLVESGWRSSAYQQRLLREAIAKYGSATEATRWVATPNRSAHVEGDAVDIGPSSAAMWLSEHGAEYALCQIYSNEPWHFEVRLKAVERGCPAMYADPSHDPRLRR